jgi:hypothetical protein
MLQKQEIHERPPTVKSILGDRMLVDLVDELEYALAVIETTGRRSRTSASSARLCTAATAIVAAIAYLRDLRG